jgi:hypothetical protein
VSIQFSVSGFQFPAFDSSLVGEADLLEGGRRIKYQAANNSEDSRPENWKLRTENLIDG